MDKSQRRYNAIEGILLQIEYGPRHEEAGSYSIEITSMPIVVRMSKGKFELSPTAERFVEQLMATGKYGSVSELLEIALRALAEKTERLRRTHDAEEGGVIGSNES